MKDVNFGIGAEIEDAAAQKEPAVALRGTTLLVTWGEDDDLKYRLGRTVDATVDFSGKHSLASGVQSTCGLARSQGRVGNLYGVEVHKSADSDDKLLSMVGRVDGNTVAWRPGSEFAIGKNPGVAVNDGLFAVEVHEDASGNTLRYHVGEVTVVRNDEKVTWTPEGNGIPFAQGAKPAVAVNSAGRVVLAWESTSSPPLLQIRFGRISGGTLSLSATVQEGPAGSEPSVALTDDGNVILVYRAGERLVHRVARLDDNPAFPAGEAAPSFDKGRRISVAAQGGGAVQIHQSQNGDTLYYSTSLVTDRGSWMDDRLDALGDKSLGELALPASHDAGLYRVERNDPTGAAQTQDLSLYGQLANGIRYFDLRLRWNENTRYFEIYHDIAGNGDAIGPRLAEVLDDVARFLGENRELAILKFSKFANFDAPVVDASLDPAGSEPNGDSADAKARRARARYQAMAEILVTRLRAHLYLKPPAEARRLAQIPLKTYLKDRPARTGLALLVADGAFPITSPSPGIYVYRDTDAPDDASPADPKGDLRVYDRYFSTAGEFYDSLIADQKDKFDSYRGADDLFLLSFTLTPIPSLGGQSVWQVTSEPSRKLAAAIKDFKRNAHGEIVNLVYVNYVESARVTDVCLYLNGVPHAGN